MPFQTGRPGPVRCRCIRGCSPTALHALLQSLSSVPCASQRLRQMHSHPLSLPHLQFPISHVCPVLVAAPLFCTMPHVSLGTSAAIEVHSRCLAHARTCAGVRHEAQRAQLRDSHRHCGSRGSSLCGQHAAQAGRCPQEPQGAPGPPCSSLSSVCLNTLNGT